jgi:hypothetical protein
VITVAPAALVMATVALWPSSAVAADKLGLSNDGIHWSSNLAAPLFDPSFRWVPGDREESAFWVRNQSSDRATLDVALVGSGIDSLMETGDLAIAVRAEGGPWYSATQVGRQSLISSMSVGPGHMEKVTVAVVFAAASTNESQVRQYDLAFDVRLTQDTSGGSDSDSDGNSRSDDDESDGGAGRGQDDGLPGTGGSPWWVFLLGTGLTAGGVALATRTRKERTNG